MVSDSLMSSSSDPSDEPPWPSTESNSEVTQQVNGPPKNVRARRYKRTKDDCTFPDLTKLKQPEARDNSSSPSPSTGELQDPTRASGRNNKLRTRNGSTEPPPTARDGERGTGPRPSDEDWHVRASTSSRTYDHRLYSGSNSISPELAHDYEQFPIDPSATSSVTHPFYLSSPAQHYYPFTPTSLTPTYTTTLPPGEYNPISTFPAPSSSDVGFSGIINTPTPSHVQLNPIAHAEYESNMCTAQQIYGSFPDVGRTSPTSNIIIGGNFDDRPTASSSVFISSGTQAVGSTSYSHMHHTAQPPVPVYNQAVQHPTDPAWANYKSEEGNDIDIAMDPDPDRYPPASASPTTTTTTQGGEHSDSDLLLRRRRRIHEEYDPTNPASAWMLQLQNCEVEGDRGSG